MPAHRKISSRQLELLIEFAETHREIALGRFLSGPQSNQLTRQTWESVALQLNAVADGVTKTAYNWRRYWIELKAKVKAKAADSRRSAAGTSGGPNKLAPLSMFEKRILALLRAVAVEGLPGVRVPSQAQILSDSSQTPNPIPTQPEPLPNPEASDHFVAEVLLDDTSSSSGEDEESSNNTSRVGTLAPIPIQTQSQESEMDLEDGGINITEHRTEIQQQQQPRRSSHSARRSLKQRLRDHSVPSWVYELELRRLHVEERTAAALEANTMALQRIAATIERVVEHLLQ